MGRQKPKSYNQMGKQKPKMQGSAGELFAISDI